jgi:hypothetical protein
MARYKAIENGVVVALTPEEEAELDTIEAEEAAGADDRAAAEVREKRNKLLAESDWVTLKAIDNSGLLTSNQAPEEWRLYRQALRDLPTHANFPNLEESDWPTSP